MKTKKSNRLLSVSFSFFGLGILAFQNPSQALDPSAVMGAGLYDQAGSNSCSYCHGKDGNGGKIAAAAKLSEPKTWKSWKALGGDAAFAKDKAGFLKNLEESITALIKQGAISFNAGFKKPYYDWAKTGGTLNAQMLGLAGAPSQAWMKKFKDRGVDKDIAAKSAYLHVQTLDKQGVFK
jgi:mono/diheme cytochrome c family protein